MRSVGRFLCCLLLFAATGLLPGCINPFSKSEKKAETRSEAIVAPETVAPVTSEAQVKPVPEPAPPAAAPPANLSFVAPPPPPASGVPEEQTKKTLEPKPIQGAALPQPKSEPTQAEPAGPSFTAPEKKTDTAQAPESQAAENPASGQAAATPTESSAAAPAGPATASDNAAKTPAKTGGVAVVGDSLAVGIGMTMTHHLGKKAGVGCYPLGKVSTGLINKKFFDWDKKLAEIVAKEKLSAVVVMMGGNDANNAIGGKPAGSPQWQEAYREKAADFLRIAAGAGLKVIWVGLPAMRDAAYNTRVMAVNAAAKDACAATDGCLYMEASSIFTDASGKYVQAKSIDGKSVSLRAKDGVHMTMTGYDLLCGQVLEKLSDTGALPATK